MRPVIISIDDLQWADQSTLEVLLYLIAGRRHRRLTVVLTVRSTELGPGQLVHPWLADARRIPGVEGVDLGPLSRSESAAQVTGLIGGPPHDSLLAEVFERTQGNAYLNRLLVAGLAASTRSCRPRCPAISVVHSWLAGTGSVRTPGI